jgi:nucleotide-binding universal stress UspA family protein
MSKMKVLLAVDGSVYTKRMLSYLAAHDELLQPVTQYTALTVVDELPAYPRAYIAPSVLEAYYKDEADKVLEPVAAYAKQKGWPLETLRKAGRAGDVVAETAQAGRYDLVVMGSRGHSGLGNLVLGSTTTRVLANCTVPVLVIR